MYGNVDNSYLRILIWRDTITNENLELSLSVISDQSVTE